MLFSDLGLNARLLSALETAGYTTATPIQVQAIPPIIAGRDVLGSAQTGTGKTAAFALPTLQRIAELKAASGSNKSVIRCVVLVPTRELALQVNSSFNKYGRGGIGGAGGVGAPLRFAVAYGGVKQGKQADALRSGVDVIVATPGRFEDLHQQGLIDLSNVALLILDEADQMLDMGFIIPIRRIAKLCPPAAPNGTRQTLMFSATMPFEIKRLATEMMRNYVEVNIAPVAATAELINQQAFRIESSSKSNLLRHYLKEQNIWKALVFSRTKHGADRVTHTLQKAGIAAAAIHGNRSQPQRTRALEAFKKGDVAVLVATDVAARGLHISEVSHVINYDMPANAETYLHRIGRTGRAGSTGTAVSFVSGEDRGILREIERLVKKPLTILPLPAAADFNASTPIVAENDHDVGDDDTHEEAPRRDNRRPQKTAYAAARPPHGPHHPHAPRSHEPAHAVHASPAHPRPTPGAFGKPAGPQKFYNNDRPRAPFNSDRPGFNNRRDDRPAFGDRPSFNNRRDDRPAYGDRPAFNNRRDDRPAFGDRPSFRNDRPSFNDRPPRGHDRPAYRDDRPSRDMGRDSARPAYNTDRPVHRAGPNSDRSAPGTGKPFNKFAKTGKPFTKTFAKPPGKFAKAGGKPFSKGAPAAVAGAGGPRRKAWNPAK